MVLLSLLACRSGAAVSPPEAESPAPASPEAPAPETAEEPDTGPTAAELAEAEAAARARIGTEEGFTVLMEAPWVVAGDGDPAAVRSRATGTVAWATRMLRQDFFAKDPDEAWTIWLFRDDASYTAHALAFFGDTPTTPYGFADGDERALVMNIGTGGGTLVHKMVHPYVGANLPGCPPWINEGLASLYEHVGEEGGHIHGYTNWRLAELQSAIHAGSLPSLRWLTDADAALFYGDERGASYAMARYLMQYLQERGKLRTFMAAWAGRREEDPTGYRTLLDTLEVVDVAAFMQEWERWAMGLRRR